jgi:hypothetical protein
VLYEAGDTINTVCFPLSAVISRCHACKRRDDARPKWWVGMAAVVCILSALDGKLAMSRAMFQLGAMHRSVTPQEPLSKRSSLLEASKLTWLYQACREQSRRGMRGAALLVLTADPGGHP